jgi:hypothetical protein
MRTRVYNYSAAVRGANNEGIDCTGLLQLRKHANVNYVMTTEIRELSMAGCHSNINTTSQNAPDIARTAANSHQPSRIPVRSDSTLNRFHQPYWRHTATKPEAQPPFTTMHYSTQPTTSAARMWFMRPKANLLGPLV